MDNYSEPKNPMERNPVAHRRHRLETRWQIYVPFAIGMILTIIISALSARLEAAETSRWADISLIWLLMPVMVLTLITLAMLAVSIYGVVKLIQVLPGYSLRLLNGLQRLAFYFRLVSDRATEPMLRLNSFGAALKTLGKQIISPRNQ